MKGAWFDQAGCLKVYTDNQEALKTNRVTFAKLLSQKSRETAHKHAKKYTALPLAEGSKLSYHDNNHAADEDEVDA